MATLTMHEILSQVTGIDEIEIKRGDEVQIIRPSEVYEAMAKWAEQIWEEACEEQTQACSEKCSDLLYNDDDAESWPKKIAKTNNVEFPY